MTNPSPTAPSSSAADRSRLWPLSRELLPKQFIRLTDDRSLLQNTLLRLDSAGAQARPTLVCNEAHRYIAAEQAQELGIKDAELILSRTPATPRRPSPPPRCAMRGGEDPVMLIMPSDHVLEDGEVRAAAYAAGGGAPGRAGDARHHPDRAAQRLWLHPGRCARRHGARPARAPLRRKALAGGRAALHRGRQLLLEQRACSRSRPRSSWPRWTGSRAHAAAGAPRSPPAWRRCAVPA